MYRPRQATINLPPNWCAIEGVIFSRSLFGSVRKSGRLFPSSPWNSWVVDIYLFWSQMIEWRLWAKWMSTSFLSFLVEGCRVRGMIYEGWRLEINLAALSGSSRSEWVGHATLSVQRVHIWDLLPCTAMNKMAVSNNAAMCDVDCVENSQHFVTIMFSCHGE